MNLDNLFIDEAYSGWYLLLIIYFKGMYGAALYFEIKGIIKINQLIIN